MDTFFDLLGLVSLALGLHWIVFLLLGHFDLIVYQLSKSTP